jgi:putative transposase
MGSHPIEIRKTYKYRLYRCDKKDRKLRHMLFVASTVWNHFIALQQRYYRLTGKYISYHDMSKHVLKLRKQQPFSLWHGLHSQVCQDVCKRVDDAYQRFFTGLAKGRPKFRKAKKYRSFTFPQSGYKVDGNTVTIGGVRYKFVKHREVGGQIKTLTVKRDAVGRLWLAFSVIEKMVIEFAPGDPRLQPGEEWRSPLSQRCGLVIDCLHEADGDCETAPHAGTSRAAQADA